MFGLRKNHRGPNATTDVIYEQRTSNHIDLRRPFNGAKPSTVDTKPVIVDASEDRYSFFYREGRDPAHQYSRVTTPLAFNASFASQFNQRFVPGARIREDATVAVPRVRNRGMQPVPPRANQYRPPTTSYGEGSQMQPGTVRAIDPRMKWAL